MFEFLCLQLFWLLCYFHGLELEVELSGYCFSSFSVFQVFSPQYFFRPSHCSRWLFSSSHLHVNLWLVVALAMIGFLRTDFFTFKYISPGHYSRSVRISVVGLFSLLYTFLLGHCCRSVLKAMISFDFNFPFVCARYNCSLYFKADVSLDLSL